MKKVFMPAVAGFALAFSVGVSAQYQEGTHYIKLDENAALETNNSVIKVYSTNCPYCYRYETAVIPSFTANLPEGVTYDAYHLQDKPPFGLEKSSVIAVARSIDEGKYKDVKMAYYKHLHDDRQRFRTSEEAIEFGLEVAGISREEYKQTVDSGDVQDMLAQWDSAMDVARQQGIPAIVVNGKYLIRTASVRSMQMLDDLTAELLTK